MGMRKLHQLSPLPFLCMDDSQVPHRDADPRTYSSMDDSHISDIDDDDHALCRRNETLLRFRACTDISNLQALVGTLQSELRSQAQCTNRQRQQPVKQKATDLESTSIDTLKEENARLTRQKMTLAQHQKSWAKEKAELKANLAAKTSQVQDLERQVKELQRENAKSQQEKKVMQTANERLESLVKEAKMIGHWKEAVTRRLDVVCHQLNIDDSQVRAWKDEASRLFPQN
jgi:chromosome segregation ATPase